MGFAFSKSRQFYVIIKQNVMFRTINTPVSYKELCKKAQIKRVSGKNSIQKMAVKLLEDDIHISQINDNYFTPKVPEDYNPELEKIEKRLDILKKQIKSLTYRRDLILKMKDKLK